MSEASLYLVEDASEDILDLTDPASLALATAKATSEKRARKLALGKKTVAAIASHRDLDSVPTELIARMDPVEQARLRKLKALADLPSLKGKIVINGNQNAKKARLEDMANDSSDDEQSSEEEETLNSKYKQLAGGKGLRRKLGAKATKQKRLPGHEYKSASARGDMSKPGKPDPYAFVPLGAALCDGPGATKADRLRLLRGIGIGSRKRRGDKSSKPSKQFSGTTARRGKPRF
ncbi:hypothetical protein Ciccas_001631 [Cichlidogyrus casuarinus]|uniref:Uncharacterized protein n=1 Tax=Cichlidogyrus casuarinus TaxID=1844966 RepID=A0ABD2QJQ5_9PLAT